MNTVTLESLAPLLKTDDEPKVSIYFPTHRSPTADHIQEDKIRFKNLIRSAKQSLESQDCDNDVIRKIGNKLEEIYDKQDFWTKTTEATAIFSTKSSTILFHLPLECEEYVYTGRDYDIAPLVALCSYDQPFNLLVLAMHEPQLYKGDMNGIEKVEIELPASPEEALNLDEPFANSQTQRARVVMGGGDSMGGNNARSSGGHGEGDTREVGNEERAAYFRIIDSKLMESKEFDMKLPLLIAAATESEVAVFRKNSKHQHILANHLNGNLTNSRPQDLRREAWPVIRSEVSKYQQSELSSRFQELVGQSKGSSDISAITEAASIGRVDTLLVGFMVTTRDTVKDDVQAAEKLIFPDIYEAKNLRDTIMATFRQGGDVVALPKDAMPNSMSVAALYRF